MSEKNLVATVNLEDLGNEDNGDDNGSGSGSSGTTYSTREECEKNKPTTAKAAAWKVYEVVRPNGGELAYTWAFTGINAVNNVARADGYEASAGTRGRRPVNKGAIALEVFTHYTEQQLKEQGYSLPIIEAIMRARADLSTKASQHPANKAAVEDNKKKNNKK